METKAQQHGHSPLIWHTLLWLFFAYLFTQILGFNQGNISNPILGGMYFIEFGVHEAGHIVFGFLPPVAVAAAGSLSEIAFTGLLVFATFRAKSYWAAIFAMLWLMLAMNSAGTYMADARAQLLPLIGAGPDPIHDWHFVFGQLGWLNADVAIGTTVKVIGDIIGTSALLFGLARIILMDTKA
jgi:hypothetical protein